MNAIGGEGGSGAESDPGRGGESADPDERSTGDGAAEASREADESGYRRDDYWREEAGEGGVAPDEVPEPAQGYRFEDTEDKANAGDTTDTDDTPTTDGGGKR